jgi:hypothetical protein
MPISSTKATIVWSSGKTTTGSQDDKTIPNS